MLSMSRVILGLKTVPTGKRKIDTLASLMPPPYFLIYATYSLFFNWLMIEDKYIY